MSKRKAEDDEDDFASNKFSKKVDTDDEDEEDEGSDDGKKYEILKEDDIEGNAASFPCHYSILFSTLEQRNNFLYIKVKKLE